VRYLRGLLSTALAHAVREDELPRNVVSAVRLPEPRRTGFTPLTADEARRVLIAATYNRYHAVFDLALRTGLRRGELLGLRWSDVDFTTGILSVRQTVQRVRHTGTVIVLPPRPRASERRIPLPADSLQVLREHRQRQELHRKTAGDRWQESGLVFTNTIGGASDPGALNRNFAATCDLAGVRRVRFHDLRHTCATLLLDQGVELITISSLLGHARIGITADVYAHVRLRLQRDAIESMGAILHPDHDPGDEDADEKDQDDLPVAA
jgi:integrase